MKQLLFTLIAVSFFTCFGSEQPGKKTTSPHYIRYLYGLWTRNRPEIIQGACIIGGFAVARKHQINSEDRDLNARLMQRLSGIAIGTGIALFDNYLIHNKNEDQKRLSEHNNAPAVVLNFDQGRSRGSVVILSIATLAAAGSIYLRHSEI